MLNTASRADLSLSSRVVSWISMTMNIVICNKKSIKTARAAFQAKFCTAGIEDNAPSEKAT